MKQETITLLDKISQHSFTDEYSCLSAMLPILTPCRHHASEILALASTLTINIREHKQNLSVEAFLQEYQLSSKEGVAIMCLAEALLRIPDRSTADALIKSTFSKKNWAAHLGQSDSLFINASSWGLLLAGKTISFTSEEKDNPEKLISGIVRSISETTLRSALKAAMRLIAKQFVLGETLDDALNEAKKLHKEGWKFSYDILGEGARTWTQAETYFQSYLTAIQSVGKTRSKGSRLFDAPSVSIKLTALHPHYELRHTDEVIKTLLPKLITLALAAQRANIAIAIDAEEAYRLDLELIIFERLCKAQEFKNFDGLGFVLQAYQKRAWLVIDYLKQIAVDTGRTIPVRLVKGAYWDSEIKHAQNMGLPDYPVFTMKAHSDTSYLACAIKLLENNTLFYPQFATHNAHTIATILTCAPKDAKFEFQRLYGMGEALHKQLLNDRSSRIYAPIGAHKDLLAYLIRRLLENGANSSFVHQIMDKNIPIEQLLDNPISTTAHHIKDNTPSPIPLPRYALSGNWQCATGMDLGYSHMLHTLPSLTPLSTTPSKQGDNDILYALERANNYAPTWADHPLNDRTNCLLKAANLLDLRKNDALNLLIQEGRKTYKDAISEWMETIEMLRYYAQLATHTLTPISLPSITGEHNVLSYHPRGTFLCISPWNFPMAIFTGQIAAALVTGNTVLAKPAEPTPRCAAFITDLLHEVGIPKDALHLILANGKCTDTLLVKDERIDGVVFTGSTTTARTIAQSLAARKGALTPLIAETGGQNCMLLDSSCLLEQALDDVLHSAFGSAGQRCSALRVLYIADDIADGFITLLKEATSNLHIGDNTLTTTDVGPVINHQAKATLEDHEKELEQSAWASLLAKAPIPESNLPLIAPQVWEIDSISRLTQEHFGPILHLIRFPSAAPEKVIEQINSTGYGLTFGIHSRIPSRFEGLAQRVKAGNIYINRSITGARVGSQPFGGEGLSGTGFKAGGQHYLLRFITERTTTTNVAAIGGNIELLMR